MGNVTRLITVNEASVHKGKAGVRQYGKEVWWCRIWTWGFLAS